MANGMIIVLAVIGAASLLAAIYYLHKNMEEHDEVLLRLRDLEIATNGYCKGELNGAFSRMLKRQKRDKQ